MENVEFHRVPSLGLKRTKTVDTASSLGLGYDKFYYAHSKKVKNITLYYNAEKNKREAIKWLEDNINEKYKISVFYYRDGEDVIANYKNYPISDNEIVVFFETDEGINLFGSKYRIRLGKTVVKDLKKYFYEKDEVDADELAAAIIKSHPKTNAIEKDDLTDLIKGELSKESWTYKFKSIFLYFKVHPLDLLNIFPILSAQIRDLRPQDPKYWNVALNNKYEPLLPTAILIKTLDLNYNKISESLGDKIIDSLDDYFKSFEKNKDAIFIKADLAIPDWLENKINIVFNNAKEFYQAIRPRIKEFIENTLIASEEYIYFINAFFTGIISGTLNFIAGIVDLVGLISKDTLDKDFNDSIREQLETFIDNLFTDTKQTLSALWEKIKLLFTKLVTYLDIKNQYELAYKLGESSFEIAEYIFTIFKLAKSKKLASFFESLKKGTKKKDIKEKANSKLDEIGKEIDEAADISKINKLKMAKKLWDDFSYENLLKIPPTKKPCFLSGTLVSTEKGLLDIEKLSIGDNVHTFNFKDNNVELKPILKLYKNKTEKFIKIHTSQDIIQATGNHRFWIPEKEKWIPASQLKIGDKFLTIENNIEKIKKLEIIEAIENTFNLEIKDNSNYYVGNSKILVHNANKVSKFASTELINVEFYEIIGRTSREAVYVGQTIQGIGKRFDQHKLDPKKAHWRNEMKGVFDIEIEGKIGPFKMTPYEAAVTELYEINNRGGKTGLYNKVNPIGKKKFNKFKKLGIFNPCKFYV